MLAKVTSEKGYWVFYKIVPEIINHHFVMGHDLDFPLEDSCCIAHSRLVNADTQYHYLLHPFSNSVGFLP